MEKEIKVIEERETIITEEGIDKNNPAYFENNEKENNEKENNENREFYVYEHIRLDNMTCFYVGKGRGKRAYDLERNDHHDRISNRYGHAVLIIKDNLTEEEAFELERDTIEDYVFNLGYGIDINGYRDYSNEKYLTNCTWGGEGTSGIKLSDEHKQKIGESMKGKNKGKHCSDEAKRKISEALKGIQMSEETKQKLSKKVICITTGKIFNSMKEASNYYKCSTISKCCREELKSSGKLQDGTPLKWKYVKDYNNEFKGILINPWNKGKKLSEETKIKMSEANSKKVICITTGEIFYSLKEASSYYNIVPANVSNCCRGIIYKSVGKLPNGVRLKWKFLENYNNEFEGILINPIMNKRY